MKNAFESVGALQIDLKFESVGFRGQGKPVLTRKKTFSRPRLRPTIEKILLMTSTPGLLGEPRAHHRGKRVLATYSGIAINVKDFIPRNLLNFSNLSLLCLCPF